MGRSLVIAYDCTRPKDEEEKGLRVRRKRTICSDVYSILAYCASNAVGISFILG